MLPFNNNDVDRHETEDRSINSDNTNSNSAINIVFIPPSNEEIYKNFPPEFLRDLIENRGDEYWDIYEGIAILSYYEGEVEKARLRIKGIEHVGFMLQHLNLETQENLVLRFSKINSDLVATHIDNIKADYQYRAYFAPRQITWQAIAYFLEMGKCHPDLIWETILTPEKPKIQIINPTGRKWLPLNIWTQHIKEEIFAAYEDDLEDLDRWELVGGISQINYQQQEIEAILKIFSSNYCGFSLEYCNPNLPNSLFAIVDDRDDRTVDIFVRGRETKHYRKYYFEDRRGWSIIRHFLATGKPDPRFEWKDWQIPQVEIPQKPPEYFENITLIDPECNTFENPDLQWIKSLICDRGDEYWDTGTRLLKIYNEQFTISFLVTVKEEYGCLISYMETDKLYKLRTQSPTEETVEIDLVFEDREVNLGDFIDRETAWRSIEYFLNIGKRDPELNWEELEDFDDSRYNRSYYMLNISAPAGSIREDARWVVTSLEDLKKAFDVYMRKSFWLTVCYGRNIDLQVVCNSRVVQCFNLLPFIKFEAEGLPTVCLDENGRMSEDVALQLRKIIKNGAIEPSEDDEIYNEDGEMNDELYNGNDKIYNSFEISIDWEIMNIQLLKGKLLQRGETTIVKDRFSSYFDDEVRYGLYDSENDLQCDSIEEFASTIGIEY